MPFITLREIGGSFGSWLTNFYYNFRFVNPLDWPVSQLVLVCIASLVFLVVAIPVAWAVCDAVVTGLKTGLRGVGRLTMLDPLLRLFNRWFGVALGGFLWFGVVVALIVFSVWLIAEILSLYRAYGI